MAIILNVSLVQLQYIANLAQIVLIAYLALLGTITITSNATQTAQV